MRNIPLLRAVRGVVVLFLVGHFSHHICTAVHMAMLPFIRQDFSLDYARSGILISSFSVAYGVAQLPAGWLADRVGRRRLISLGLVAVALIAFSIGLTQSYYQVALLLALLGIFGGSYHPSAPPLISESVPPESRGSALGIHTTGGSASYFATPLLAGAIALALGWREAFMILSLPTLVAGLLFLRFARERGTALAAAPAAVEPSLGIVQVVRRLGLVVVIAILAQSVSFGVTPFITLYLVDKHGVQPAHASMMLSLIYGAGLVAAPIGGTLSDWVGRKPVIMVTALAAGPLIYLLNIVTLGPGLWALFLAIGMTIYARMPVLESLIVDVIPARQRSSILGMYYFVSMEASSIVSPVVGYLMDRLGMEQAFTIVALWVLVSTSMASLFLLYSGRHKEDVPG